MVFSVIIPTYNRAAYLPQTLDSAWRQSFTDFEVVVVDDGSTDGTLEYLESLGNRLRFLRQANKGPGAARNLGAAQAQGTYLAFLDSDDLWFPWTLGTFNALIRKHRSPAILSGCLLEFSNEAELATVRDEPAQGRVFSDYLAASPTGFHVGSGMAVLRRDEFSKSGGFVTGRINAEDHDLALRLGTAPKFVQVLNPVTLGWRRHAGGETKNVRQAFEGSRYLVEQEHSGAYPGGVSRSRERREIISRHVRPVALECLRQGIKKEAWQLYRNTFGWHAKLGRWKYLAGFPVKALLARA